MSAIFCLTSVLATQGCFLCEKPLSGVLRVYVKLKIKSFYKRKLLSRYNPIYIANFSCYLKDISKLLIISTTKFKKRMFLH